MSRTILPAFQTYLQTDGLTLAVCVKLTRRDATVLGFTSGNKDLLFSGVTYEASNAFTSSVLKQDAGNGIDNLDIIGLLRSDRITDADIQAGLYDGATLEMFVVNYADLTMGAITLLKGMIGQVTLTDGQYRAELRSLMQRMSQTVGELTSRTCRVVRLGDARCKMVLTGTDPNTGLPYRVGSSVTVVVDPANFTISSVTQASGYFNYGMVTFGSGLNNGLQREIKQHTLSGSSAVLSLQEPFPYAVAIGDTATIEVGCDRLFGTCVTKFNNGTNFRGESHIPGLDQMLKTGRGG